MDRNSCYKVNVVDVDAVAVAIVVAIVVIIVVIVADAHVGAACCHCCRGILLPVVVLRGMRCLPSVPCWYDGPRRYRGTREPACLSSAAMVVS